MIDIINIALHLDKYLQSMISEYGALTYLILFLIIFFETGVVLTPFLPGDSLIFIAGVFAGNSALNILVLFIVLSFAAIMGDTLNYWIGNYFGKKVFSKYINPRHIEKTRHFYEEYGAKTIVLARFVPIIRTIAPFVAGVGKMNYSKFLLYNVFGAVLWVTIFLFSGYFFGGIPIIRDNLTLVVILVIFVSTIPVITEYLRRR
jgi:membrane-associated protein